MLMLLLFLHGVVIHVSSSPTFGCYRSCIGVALLSLVLIWYFPLLLCVDGSLEHHTSPQSTQCIEVRFIFHFIFLSHVSFHLLFFFFFFLERFLYIFIFKIHTFYFITKLHYKLHFIL